MKRNILIIFFIAAMTAIYGCANGNSDNGNNAISGFIGGTNGIVMEFMEDSPPDFAYDGGDFFFDIVVKLENVGEFTVPKDKVLVSISGVQPSEFSLNDSNLLKKPTEDIEAKKKDSEGNIIEPGPVFVEFNNFNHKEKLVTNNEFPFRADICYTYQTKAETKICIKRDNLKVEEGVCIVNEDKTVSNSGAPVQVKDFKEVAKSKEKIGFTFTVVHQGNGNIFNKNSLCENQRELEDKVYVTIDSGLSGLECSGLEGKEGYVTLYSGERLISCTQPTSTQSDFIKPVSITLDYKYKESKETKVLIKHSTE